MAKNPKPYLVKCPECGEVMVLKRSKFGLFYGCQKWPRCDGIQPAYPSGRPMGTNQVRATKQERVRAQEVFDDLRIRREWTRKRAYTWLAKKLNMTRKECHIGKFDEATCARVLNICERNDP